MTENNIYNPCPSSCQCAVSAPQRCRQTVGGTPSVCYLLLFTLIAFPSCSKGRLEIVSGELGSYIGLDGTVQDASLKYRFKHYTGGDRNRDLFNYIYFKGDNVCFSFIVKGRQKGDRVYVWFIDPKSGERFEAERVDYFSERVSGFTLLGSLLEKFNKARLGDEMPVNAYCCRDIAFEVMISVRREGMNAASRIKGAFRIEYE